MSFTTASSGLEVDVDTEGWVGMEFPLPDQILGTIGIVRVEKVFDPEHGGKVINAPEEPAVWIANLPGVNVIRGPGSVTVGGIVGERFDALIGPENVEVGPIPGTSDPHNGFPQKHAVRIILLSVGGQFVQISFAPDETGSKHFNAAVDYVQPLIESIRWG